MRTSNDSGGEDCWRVAVVEDHLLQRLRTESLVDAQRGMRVVASVETLPELIVWLRRTDVSSRPHLVILDLVVDRAPSVDPAAVRSLVNVGIRVLVLSAMASPNLVRAVMRAGATGILGNRDSEESIVEAMWSTLREEPWITSELAAVMAADVERPALSDQEERALVLYASGLTLASVAAALGVEPDTAKKYVARVKAKYAAVGRPVRTKVDLHREARRDGLVGLDPAVGEASQDPRPGDNSM